MSKIFAAQNQLSYTSFLKCIHGALRSQYRSEFWTMKKFSPYLCPTKSMLSNPLYYTRMTVMYVAFSFTDLSRHHHQTGHVTWIQSTLQNMIGQAFTIHDWVKQQLTSIERGFEQPQSFNWSHLDTFHITDYTHVRYILYVHVGLYAEVESDYRISAPARISVADRGNETEIADERGNTEYCTSCRYLREIKWPWRRQKLCTDWALCCWCTVNKTKGP
jgi:hypothetical protein